MDVIDVKNDAEKQEEVLDNAAPQVEPDNGGEQVFDSELIEAAGKLGDGRGSFGMDQNYTTVGDFVDDLVDSGNQEEVFAYTDSHLGLKDGLSDEFLATPIDGVDISKYQGQIDDVIYECENILPRLGGEITEDMADDIAEDKMARGEEDE